MTLPFNRPVPRCFGLEVVRCPVSGRVLHTFTRNVHGRWVSVADEDQLDLSRFNQTDRREHFRRKH